MKSPTAMTIQHPEPRANSSKPTVGRLAWTLVKCLFAAWLLASLLFAHGCHGDEDHELFTAAVEHLGLP